MKKQACIHVPLKTSLEMRSSGNVPNPTILANMFDTFQTNTAV